MPDNKGKRTFRLIKTIGDYTYIIDRHSKKACKRALYKTPKLMGKPLFVTVAKQ